MPRDIHTFHAEGPPDISDMQECACVLLKYRSRHCYSLHLLALISTMVINDNQFRTLNKKKQIGSILSRTLGFLLSSSGLVGMVCAYAVIGAYVFEWLEHDNERNVSFYYRYIDIDIYIGIVSKAGVVVDLQTANARPFSKTLPVHSVSIEEY